MVNSSAIDAMNKWTKSLHIPSFSQPSYLNNIQDSLQPIINSYLPGIENLKETLSVNNLIDQHFLDSCQGFHRHLNIESDALKSISESMGLNNQMLQKSISSMYGSLNINSFTKLDSTHELIKSFSLNTKMLDSLQSSMNSTLLEQVDKYNLNIESLANSAINNFNNLQTSINIDTDVADNLFYGSSVNDNNLPVDNDLLIEALESIQEEKDFKQLPDNVKAIAFFIFNLVANALISMYVGMYWYEVQQMQTKLQQAESVIEVKRTMKEVGLSGHREFLKGYRVTTGTDIQLRDKPKMKSNVSFELPMGKMLNVLDKSNRSWLYVEVEIDDELVEGWVSRQYTDYFR